MTTSNDLKQLLQSIDRKSYPAYKSLKGSYRFPEYILHIDHVQGDPFASPSKISIEISGNTAKFPPHTYDEKYKRVALTDHLLRLFSKMILRYQGKARGSGKSGLLAISKCGQEILERTACTITPSGGDLLLHMEIGFPANGRTIQAQELDKILFDYLPKSIPAALIYKNIDHTQVERTICLAEDQQYIRAQLKERKLCAFIANDAILPRESGVSQTPMKNAVPFQSPADYEISLNLPHKGRLTGMGIPKGITLIVGGGYHGKSTLLKALELGVYNHVSGDGREYVITDDSAVKIRAEDGRSIKGTDISYFIRDLPNRKDTSAFFTEDASGSTSQAANVVEAIEAGSKLLLIDEDTSATNFMIRDELMQRVVHRNQEPIIPFIERVEQLYESEGVSTILVAGSSGSYFHIAHHIVQMDRYVPKDVTAFAKEEAEAFPFLSLPEDHKVFAIGSRYPKPSQSLLKESRLKCKTLSKDAFSLNRDTIDLRYVEQLTDYEQTQALMYCLLYAQKHFINGRNSLTEVVNALLNRIECNGLASILPDHYVSANLALPRREELFACLNRYRGL